MGLPNVLPLFERRCVGGMMRKWVVGGDLHGKLENGLKADSRVAWTPVLSLNTDGKQRQREETISSLLP